ncbi:probable aspartic proteinase GIP2 [Lotus japonicus]|uniref:probable aspartic proteinase GIP2 n=1 Tax=Lotus japonicus TaxID=34305 RepID=UPI0025886577|nr:probable aspartic proteinase GIP2 [Lotus japonicus]
MTYSSVIHFFLFSIALFSVPCLSISHSPNSKPHPFLLPIKKDPATNVFYTSIGIGTPQQNFNVAIDLAGENLWYECNNHYNSSSFHPIICESNKCPKNTHACSFCQGQFRPGCTNNTCGTTNYNPLAQVLFPGDLAEDVVSISQNQVFGVSSGCTNSDGFNGLLEKLPKSSQGIIGLARSQLALPTQLALLKKLPPKFSLCLPSSNNIGFTNLLIGTEEHPLSKYMQTTPLILNPVDTGPEFEEGVPSTEHFIDVTSVKIDGQVVNLKPSLLSIKKDGNGGTRMSTMTRFAELQSSVYKPFILDFIKKASDRRMKRVASVAPFEACFDVTTIGNSRTGLAVPSIDLVLRGGAVWTIHGANSMVMVKKNVACLGFVDGGTIGTMSFVKASIVLGAHQLEENLLMFDLASNKFSFSSSLLLHNASCSNF